MVEPKLIQRQKLFEQVASHLEQQILYGELKPGDRLPPERDLQAAFGVGRPAIREALITLERAGLIEIGSGARARVAMPTAAGLMSALVPSVLQMLSRPEANRELQALRLLIEVGLVREAARNASPEDIAALRAALADNEACRSDREAFIDSDVAFHFVFAQMARNSVFLAIHHAMSTWLREQRVIALRGEGETDRACAAHARILAAVEAGDPDAAETAMREHLREGWASYWSHVDDRPPARDGGAG